MKKKYSIEELESKETEILDEEKGHEKDNSKTPVAFSKKKKLSKKKKRIIVLTIAALFLSVLGYFGWLGYRALTNIFNGDAPSLLNLITDKQLKGESSGRINVLLLGMGDKGHEGENLTDTIMVVSLDPKTKDVAMISIPRDLYVNIDKYGYSKINAAHAYGEKYKVQGGGPQLAKDTISKVINQPIHYYARIDFTGFKKVVDLVGGVDIDVEKDLYDPLYPGGTFYIKKGRQHMNGEVALKYARSRETTSDFDRAKRQQQVIMATKEKVLSSQTLLNPKKISEMVNILGDHIKTDMEIWEAQRIYNLTKDIDNSKIINKVFDNGPGGLLVNDVSDAGAYILIPSLGLGNYKEIQNAVKNIFVDSKLQTEGAKIAVLNGTGKSGIAATFSEKLRNASLNVVSTATADRSDFTKSVVIDYTNGAKSATLAYLKNLLNAEVQVKTGGSVDFEVILGKDYLTN